MTNNFYRPFAASVLAGLLLGLAHGCGELINPFRDDLPPTEFITTASADLVHSAPAAGTLRHRDWTRQLCQTQDLGVTHWPLWWEDSLEMPDDGNVSFCWTWLDYAGIVYCPARQVVNTAGLPLSMVVDPPAAVRCSDGRISRQIFGFSNHDAVACGGAEIPPDIIEAYEPPAVRKEHASPPAE